MAGLLATGTAILINGLALLGMAFILSRGFPWLRARPARHRAIILGIAFGVMTIGTMTMSYPMGPGIIGDLRHVVIAVAAIVGGPVPALVAAPPPWRTASFSAANRAAGIFGIAVAAGLSIGFAQIEAAEDAAEPCAVRRRAWRRPPRRCPLPRCSSRPCRRKQAVRIGALFFAYTVFVFPIGIVVIGGLLMSEERRAEEEAELKTLNATLSLQAAREQGVFESSGVAIAWVDLATGRLIRANPQYAKFTGYLRGRT